jgi:hypothetical protein
MLNRTLSCPVLAAHDGGGVRRETDTLAYRADASTAEQKSFVEPSSRRLVVSLSRFNLIFFPPLKIDPGPFSQRFIFFVACNWVQ